MKNFRNLLILFSVFSLFFAPSGAVGGEKHSSQDTKDLGEVHFPVSCGAKAQKKFDHAMAQLHSFWYDEAEKSFRAVTQDEPGCAMAYWGIAMSLYHPLWAPPGPEDLKAGSEAVREAGSMKKKSDREKAYIAAIEVFYKDHERLDHRTRAQAYEKAMERVFRTHPDDPEAAILYALALNGTALPTDKSYANQKKAADILTKIFAEKPRHPGVVHYIVHSYDSPQLAELALSAARSYAQIAPASPHALHMPSHIFTRLGLWSESISSNLASATASKERVSRMKPGSGSFEQLHAMDYLMYAYLQGGQDSKARQVLDEMNGIDRVDAENFAAAYAFAAVPARYVLEQRKWADAASLKPHPAGFPWGRFRYAEAITTFARALGAVRSGNLSQGQKEIENLEAIRNALLEGKDSYWADQVEIQRRAAAAWLAHAKKQKDEALSIMRSAADLEDSTEKHPVTPGPILPARELLGELLMEMGHPDQALAEFEASLRTAPNRFNTIYGAAHAAVKNGDHEKAAEYYARLLAVGSHADGERPELQEAKDALTAKIKAGSKPLQP